MKQVHVAWVVAAAVFTAAGLPVSPCMAQATNQPAAQGSIDEYTSGALVRLALLDLRALDDPKPRDFGITLGVLEEAGKLAPNNIEIVRRCSEAAWNAADQPALLASTRQLIELDPKDTVAQLRLLTAQIGLLQTAEERLKAYDRALGAAGESLDPAVRSRLALDAALLLRERGDQDGYLRRLKQALQLDVSNKEAAFLAVQYYVVKSEDIQGRLEVLSNMLMADPLDAAILMEIRDGLAQGGAIRAASRFHNIGAKLFRAAGTGDDAQLDLDSLIIEWRLEGARPALKLLEDQLAAARRNVERSAESSASGGLSFTRRAEDVRLSISFEEPRMATAISLGDNAELSASLTDMIRSIHAQQDVLRDAGRRPTDFTEEKANEYISHFTALGTCWHGLVGALAPEALKTPAAVSKPAPTTPEDSGSGGKDTASSDQPTTPPAPPPPMDALAEGVEPLADAWRAIEAGDYVKAKAAFDQVTSQDDVWVAMGRAVILEKTGSPEAAGAYHAIAAKVPLSVLGAIANDREALLMVKARSSAPQWARADALETFAKTIPSWIDGMVDRPMNFEAVSADPVLTVAGVQDRVRVRIRLRNLAPIPLALGSSSPINTRLLFLPSMETGGRVDAPDAEVVDVNRRLRLMPGEELDCVVWPEAGRAGYEVEQACNFPTRISWRVLQGFEAQGESTRVAGPGCVELRTGVVLHQQLPEARLSLDQLVGRISGAGNADLPGLLVAARIQLGKGDPAANDRIAQALAMRYPFWSPAGRMLAISSLPPTAACSSLKVLDAQVAKDTDTHVLLVGVVARAGGPDDPILTAAAAAGAQDPALAKVVEAQRERMKDGVKTYSQIGISGKSAAPAAPAAPAPAAPASPLSSAPTNPSAVMDVPVPPKP